MRYSPRLLLPSLLYLYVLIKTRFQFGRSYGITVNTLAPGPVETEQERKFQEENPDGAKDVQRLVDDTRAANRKGNVEDLADAVLLIVQEKSRWITGQYIDVSGGITGH
jgi:NAD(P)-dependent dehydrogenase (short-subunit alcohol dehydrogenase family)